MTVDWNTDVTLFPVKGDNTKCSQARTLKWRLVLSFTIISVNAASTLKFINET